MNSTYHACVPFGVFVDSRRSLCIYGLFVCYRVSGHCFGLRLSGMVALAWFEGGGNIWDSRYDGTHVYLFLLFQEKSLGLTLVGCTWHWCCRSLCLKCNDLFFVVKA